MTPNDVKIVAENIDDFIEVPGGVARLRKAVLALAVSGKLVAEDKGDGSAEDLYKKIQVSRLGKKKEVVEYDSITKKETPFEIPTSWKWVRLGAVCEFVYGDGLPKEERKENGKYKAYGANGPLALTNLANCEMGGVIVGRKGSAGAVTLVSEPFFATDVTYFIPSGQYGAFETNYLYFLLLALDLPKHAKGIKPGISRKEVYALPVALPPFSTQKRIVKKVEEVMKQLDELETKKRDRDEARTRLARSAMQSLGRGESKIAFEHLTELIKTPADLKELEGALITLAVSGKLVAQDKKDDAVESPKATTEYGEEFSIPKSWAWFQLNDVCTFKYGYTDSAKESGTARFVRITDMGSDGNLITDDQRYVDLSPESRKYLLSEGDLLTARIGATFGRTIIFREKYKAIFASYLIRMSFEKNFILPEYYWVFSQSGLYWNQAHSLVSGSAQPQFNANLIKKMYLPVPPLAEQKRIVKKVEEVMLLIDKLRGHISS